MHSNKMYSRLVFYMEACESGSMFEKLLPTDLNIYATTAANGKVVRDAICRQGSGSQALLPCARRVLGAPTVPPMGIWSTAHTCRRA